MKRQRERKSEREGKGGEKSEGEKVSRDIITGDTRMQGHYRG